MQTLLAAIALLVSSAFALDGWTYKTTDSSCQGTAISPCGQAYWSKVPNSAVCNSGSKQSPVDISNTQATNSYPQPKFTSSTNGCKTWTQFSTNYTFEVAFNEPDWTCSDLSFTLSDTVYTLQQIHFHSPSEHTLGGGHYDGEAHFVHKSPSNSLIVLGVFLQAAADHIGQSNNTFLSNFWDHSDGHLFDGEEVEVEADNAINPYYGFLPGNSGRFIYTGSLTTPPCAEVVTFYIYESPVIISQDDLTILRKAAAALPHTTVSPYGNTNRNVQSLNGRTITYVPATAEDSSANNDDYDLTSQNAVAGVVLAVIALALALILGFALLVSCSVTQQHKLRLAELEAKKAGTNDV